MHVACEFRTNAPPESDAGSDPLRLAREILQASDDGMYALDREGRLLEINPAACEYFGRPREQLLGLPLLTAFPQARGGPLEAAVRAVLNGGPAVRVEIYSPSWPDRRKVVKVFSTSRGVGVWFRNVTRERTEEEARLAELEGVYQAAPVGLALLDRDLRYLRCNARLAELNGVGVLEHLGRRVREVAPHLADDLEPRFLRVFETGEPSVDREVSGPAPGRPGETRTWLENVCPLRDAHEAVSAIIVTVQDITERKRAEAAHADRATKLRAAQELSFDGFMILRAIRDGQGQVEDFSFEFANRAARDFGPAPDADPANASLLQAMPQLRGHPQVFPRYVRVLGEQGRDEGVVVQEVAGEPRWFRNAVVALDRDRVAVSFQDITPQHQAEEQLRLIIRELEHRGKNTLALVQGLMRLTLRGSLTMGEFQRSFSDRLQVLSEAHLLITRSDDQPVPLADIVVAALAPFRQPGLQVRTGPAAELPAVAAVSLTLALHELATNAVKYGALSREQGVVSFGWTAHDGRIEILWEEAGGPPVAEPVRRGLGSPLVESALQGVRGASVRHEFAREGVRCRMSFPVVAAPAV